MIEGSPSPRDSLLAVGHRTRLGMLGERLAMECLDRNGFAAVRDLNQVRFNNVYADLRASFEEVDYIISVKARNRLTDVGKLNASYNLLKANASKDKTLRAQGCTTDDITIKLYEELQRIASREVAIPAWVTVAIDTTTGTFSAYFGLASDLRQKRSIPMTPAACSRYKVLAANLYDARIVPGLSNARAE